ncbi:MAG: hypothetical protein AAF741_04595 [Bacteroidota bacterium]
MKRTFLIFILLWPLLASAQSFDLAAGLRLGTEWGATALFRVPQIHKNFTIEAIAQQSMSKDEGRFTLLGRRHHPFLTRRLNIFMGGGFHLGWTNELDPETAEPFGNPWGLTAIVGAEITIGRTNISYDIRPAVNLGGRSVGPKLQTGISIRYVIAKRNDIWDRKKERTNNRERKKRQRQRRKEKRRREREKNGGGGIWPFNRNNS